METFEDMQVAVAFCTALRAHNVSTEQLDALRENDLALQTVAALIRRLTAHDNPVGQAVAAAGYEQLYPDLSDEMPVRIWSSLYREGITDVGILQVCTTSRLLDVRNLGEKSIRHIQDYLTRRNMRLREENEPRHDRMRYVYPDAALAPVFHLPVETYELKEVLSIRTYGDLQRFKRSDLAKLRDSWPYGDKKLVYTSDDLDKIEIELAHFGLRLAPESE